MLAIGRGLMLQPQAADAGRAIDGHRTQSGGQDLRSSPATSTGSCGITILLVEQNVREALELANRAYVLQTGRVVKDGTGEEMLQSDAIQKAYLGL